MPGDMLVVVGASSTTGGTLFGHNSHRSSTEPQRLIQQPGGMHTLEESVQTQYLRIPQARRTLTVLASQPEGCCGYQHGVNAQRLAVGCTSWRSLLCASAPTLTGPDLVRLLLERAPTARQGVDLLLDLVRRHGQGRFRTDGAAHGEDATLLLADPREGFAVELAGPHAAVQEIGTLRAASDVSIIHRDWNRLTQGLADYAIGQHWCPEDGRKLDYATVLSDEAVGQHSALRRWGRATWLLEQQLGHIDQPFLRRVLGDHYEGTRYEVDPAQCSHEPVPLCRHTGPFATVASCLVELQAQPEQPLLAWCAFGPPCVSVYFPVFVEAPLPAALAAGQGVPLWRKHQWLRASLHQDEEQWQRVRESVTQLQEHIDRATEDLLEALRTATQPPAAWRDRATQLLDEHLQEFEHVCSRVLLGSQLTCQMAGG